MKLRFYDTATSRYHRTLDGEASKVSVCVDARLLPHICGFLETLTSQFLVENQEEVDELIGDFYESLLKQVPCNYGADFKLDTPQARSLEVLQAENLPPPPWEFRIIEGQLEYRTEEQEM